MDYKVGDYIHWTSFGNNQVTDIGIIMRIEGTTLWCIWMEDVKEGDKSEYWVGSGSDRIRLATKKEIKKMRDVCILDSL